MGIACANHAPIPMMSNWRISAVRRGATVVGVLGAVVVVVRRGAVVVVVLGAVVAVVVVVVVVVIA